MKANPSSKKKILVIDDDRAVCVSLKLLLQKSDYIASSLHHFEDLGAEWFAFMPDLVILDMNFSIDTSGKQGLIALGKIQEISPQTPVILMTGWATVALAVEGMKRGAKDFIAKPWNNIELLKSIETTLQISDMHTSSTDRGTKSNSSIIAYTSQMVEILDKAAQIAPTNASVLITGESGTGKELLAEFIHLHSVRAEKEFVKVNLGGVAHSLFESELFGHKKGAFTDAHADRIGRFEKAHGGTIFLDEIGELSLPSQVKLLRVLQEKTYEKLGTSQTSVVDARIISATNRILPTMIADGSFREDLYYRINLIHFHLPPLRERKEDIPKLVDFFASKICQNYQLELPEFSPDIIAWLQSQILPGNIRQLSNCIERVLLLNIGSKQITLQKFINALEDSNPQRNLIHLPEVGKISLEELEKEMIKKTLIFHQNSISKSARSLGITRSALYRRLEKYNIPHESES